VAAAEPLYVVRLDAARREVVVGPRDCLRARTLTLRDVNWLGDEPFEAAARGGVGVLARIRSTGPLRPATVSLDKDTVIVDFADGEEGVSPGQACVFYAAAGGGERLLGGGWIKSTNDGAWLAESGFAAPASRRPAEAFAAGSR
jgi:tRNA-specific 2-thiouridylase